jgi:hypothetical protein
MVLRQLVCFYSRTTRVGTWRLVNIQLPYPLTKIGQFVVETMTSGGGAIVRWSRG